MLQHKKLENDDAISNAGYKIYEGCQNDQFVKQYNDCTNDFSRDNDKDNQESDDDDEYLII